MSALACPDDAMRRYTTPHCSTLRALSVGYNVPCSDRRSHRFTVHSRFRHALNLVDVDSSGGALLTLLDARHENAPSAIRLATPDHWDWRERVDHAQPVLLSRRVLSGDGWRVLLDGAPCWRPESLDALDAAGLAGAVGVDAAQSGPPGLPSIELHALLAGQLRHYCVHHGLHATVQWLPGWPADGRVAAFALDDTPQCIHEQVSRLVGFGAGLTPDGDDHLLGYLAALRPWRRLEAVAAHGKRIDAALAGQLHGTTDISRHYLGLALRGHFSEPMNRLIAAIARDAPSTELCFAAERVMQFGSTSGAASLAGVLHGLRTIGCR